MNRCHSCTSNIQVRTSAMIWSGIGTASKKKIVVNPFQVYLNSLFFLNGFCPPNFEMKSSKSLTRKALHVHKKIMGLDCVKYGQTGMGRLRRKSTCTTRILAYSSCDERERFSAIAYGHGPFCAERTNAIFLFLRILFSITRKFRIKCATFSSAMAFLAP